MRIDKNWLVMDIQHEFNKLFPFLKIEFCKYAGKLHADDPPVKLNPSQTISSIIKMNEQILLHVHCEKNISELKDEFKKIGLYATVYRQSGKVWIETSLTNDWTLNRQNREGEIFSR